MVRRHLQAWKEGVALAKIMDPVEPNRWVGRQQQELLELDADPLRWLTRQVESAAEGNELSARCEAQAGREDGHTEGSKRIFGECGGVHGRQSPVCKILASPPRVDHLFTEGVEQHGIDGEVPVAGRLRRGVDVGPLDPGQGYIELPQSGDGKLADLEDLAHAARRAQRQEDAVEDLGGDAVSLEIQVLGLSPHEPVPDASAHDIEATARLGDGSSQRGHGGGQVHCASLASLMGFPSGAKVAIPYHGTNREGPLKLLLLLVATALAENPPGPGVGDDALLFSLPAINEQVAIELVRNDHVGLGDLTGPLAGYPAQAVVLYFFTRTEGGDGLSPLNRCARKYSRQDVRFIAISTDEGDLAALSEWVRSQKLGFPVLRDNHRIVSGRYGIEEVPRAYILDGTGRIHAIGAPNATELEADVEAALGSLLGE